MKYKGRLTVKQINRLLAIGKRCRVPDGDGLYLRISNRHKGSWEKRYNQPCKSAFGETFYKPKTMGLGPAQVFNLAKARERNQECNKLLADEIDPRAAWAATRAANRAKGLEALYAERTAREERGLIRNQLELKTVRGYIKDPNPHFQEILKSLSSKYKPPRRLRLRRLTKEEKLR